jgi:hypothetical protein
MRGKCRTGRVATGKGCVTPRQCCARCGDATNVGPCQRGPRRRVTANVTPREPRITSAAKGARNGTIATCEGAGRKSISAMRKRPPHGSIKTTSARERVKTARMSERMKPAHPERLQPVKAAAEAAQVHAAEMHAAHVQAAQASQSASAKPVEAAATETMEAAASTVEATASTVEAAPAKAARQSRRCAYYKGQQNSAQLTGSPHNAPHRRARLCLAIDQTPKLLIMFPIRAFD